MTYLFKGMDIVLADGNHVKFSHFIYSDNKKCGWFDMDGKEYQMSDLSPETV